MPFTILVIDDELEILETVAELLAMDGHRVLSASGGADGLSQACAERPDLILVDYNMPGMDGLAVVKRLKADAATRSIPVVALTGGTAAHANELSRAGCVGFIPKPFEPPTLLRLVTGFLNQTVGRNRRIHEEGPGP